MRMSDQESQQSGGTPVTPIKPRSGVGQKSGLDNNVNRKEVVKTYKALQAIEVEIAELNAKKNALKGTLAARGFAKKAINHHFALWKLEQQDKVESSYGESMRVLSRATQMSLFEPLSQADVAEAASNAAEARGDVESANEGATH